MQSYKQYNRSGVMTREHREVWGAANGPIPYGYHIDHINGDIHDNRLENLRLCSLKENVRNSKLSTKNRTGLKGLSWDAVRERWRGAIRADGKQHSLTSKDLLEVCCWLFTARKELHGEFARHY